MSRTKSMLEPLRARVRRAQLIIGLGFLSLILGVFFFAGTAMKLGPALNELGAPLLGVLVSGLLARAWLLVILPSLAWIAARAFDLKPWNTAIGAAATGELFLLALEATTGTLATLFQAPLVLVMRIATLAGGILLTAWAVRRARASATSADARAQSAASERKAEYDAFLAESARLAERSAVSGEVSAVGGESAAVSGESSAVSGESSAVSGESSAVSGESSAVSAEASAVDGESVAMIGEESAEDVEAAVAKPPVDESAA